ncbi:RCC1 domain-containing protein [Deinococcus cellulosilyticus]|uniref:BIG2 domain-containing protein n=1 Tax=Deinococcus cellulosilyticus (strain DSM 18568 / NBRC 106333 / KACC 11606 / 5516J-15) TaxID=1223518 RepID=A0A511N7B5_DEIC1|nr:hypothetical protein [Deinococcus cellulosilyticus]GEM48387.1 hypothetical protein DC3_40220 [Deinococcus cellulosilyticus NBRC 106333 = KACC 11606]
METGQQQVFTATLKNTSNTKIQWTTTGGTLVSNGLNTTYTAGNTPGNYTLTATSDADNTKKVTASIKIIAPLQITIQPSSKDIKTNETLHLTALLNNPDEPPVVWTASGGTLTFEQNTATFKSSTPGTFIITATSRTNNQRRAQATIIVTDQIGIALSPVVTTLKFGEEKTFTATVTNAKNPAVTWKLSGTEVGTLVTNGNTATLKTTQAGDFTLSAISVENPQRQASMDIKVLNPVLSLKFQKSSTLVNEPVTVEAVVENAVDGSVSWLSSGGSITGSGNTVSFQSSDPGDFTVVATSNASSGVRTSTVIHVYSRLMWDKAPPASLEVGSSVQIKASEAALWTSTAPEVASIDLQGVVTAWKAGTTSLKASTSDGRTLEAQLTVTAVPLTLDFQKVSANFSTTCGVTSTGDVSCWGFIPQENLAGLKKSPIAQPITSPVKLVSVATGNSHACGLTADGHAYCWGNGGNGQLGNGSNEGSNVPVQVSEALTFKQISVGQEATCAAGKDGHAYCWGGYAAYLLGSNQQVRAYTPVQIPSSLTFTQVETTGWYACGLTVQQEVHCWGQYGGYGSITPIRTAPALTFQRITLGRGEICGISTSAKAYCWGHNALANQPVYSDANPIEVAVGLPVTDIQPGDFFRCALTSNEEVYCWGSNEWGQLGIGDAVKSEAPTKILSPLKFDALSVGLQMACAVSTSRKAYCWGANYNGQVGNGTESDVYAPSRVLTDP